MNKFLFTDGVNGVKEALSREELQRLVSACPYPEQVRIWEFNSLQWISYDQFCKRSPGFAVAVEMVQTIPSNGHTVTRKSQGKNLLRKFLFLTIVIASAFLVFNFTRVKWETAGTQTISPARPGNTPVMDVDSLITELEYLRGQKLDRSTRTNLRLRNTWPERILVEAVMNKETSKNEGARFSAIGLSVDNTTGFPIDNVVVKLSIWKNNEVNESDTIRFQSLPQSGPVKRDLSDTYYGDSISVSVESIRARSFNFCYSAKTRNDEHYDRWFCRD